MLETESGFWIPVKDEWVFDMPDGDLKCIHRYVECEPEDAASLQCPHCRWTFTLKNADRFCSHCGRRLAKPLGIE